MVTLNMMMPAASAQLGTLARRWERSARSRRSKSGPLASFSIARDASRDRAGPEIRTRAIVVQQKTGRPGSVRDHQRRQGQPSGLAERHEGTIEDYAFPSRIDRAHIP